MRVYNTIIFILEKKGPLPFPALCHEVNHFLMPFLKKPLLPSHIQSIITRKKELFHNHDGIISLKADKLFCSLITTLDAFDGLSYKVNVNFIKNRFTALEWRNKDNHYPFTGIHPDSAGYVDEFKRELYSIHLWDWEPVYQKNPGVVLDGKYWSVKLVTVEKVYESHGTEAFPPHWNQFCQALKKLTGLPFQ